VPEDEGSVGLPAGLPAAAALAAALAAELRARDVPVPVRSVLDAAEAFVAVGEAGPGAWYWAGRATLVRRPADLGVYDDAWRATFGAAPARPPGHPTPAVVPAPAAVVTPGGDGPAGAGSARRVVAGVEVLDARRDFAAYTDAEHRAARRVMERLATRSSVRRSHRYRPARTGRRLDLARTVRAALASDGELVRHARRGRRSRPRRLVLVLDVSGSMADYERALLGLAHAAVRARPAVEVFTVGTRCTRITRELADHDPDGAFAAVGARVTDAAGGTRLGECLRSFNTTWGVRGLARGAEVVICSDGWDAGDPALLAAQMARMRRVAHRVLWVNPLRATPGYAPTAGGMAAALAHLDAFCDGHSLEAVAELFDRLAADDRTRRRGPAGVREAR